MSLFSFFIVLSHLLTAASLHLHNNRFTGWILDPEWYQDFGDSFHIPNLPYNTAQLHNSDVSQSSPILAAQNARHLDFSSRDFINANLPVLPSVDFSDEPLAYERGEWWADPEFFNEPWSGLESGAIDAGLEPPRSLGLKGFFAQLRSRLYGFRSVSEEESVPRGFRFILNKKKTVPQSLRAIRDCRLR